MTEDKMVGRHHELNGHEFEQSLGVGDGQESLVSCSPWSRKESDMTEQLNWTEHYIKKFLCQRKINMHQYFSICITLHFRSIICLIRFLFYFPWNECLQMFLLVKNLIIS